MSDEGIEALADGALLLAVLLVASGVVLALASPPTAVDPSDGLRYAEDVRLALFRTTMDGLGHATPDGFAAMPDGTDVETFLRVQVELRAGGVPAEAFAEANARIADLAARLVRPGWGVAVTGRLAGGSDDLVLIPGDVALPATYHGSGWTYPSLDGSADVRLAVAVWPTPPR